jgi:hypothetical protein
LRRARPSWRFAPLLIVLAFVARGAIAGEPLEPQARDAVARCLDVIRKAQLPDGAMRMDAAGDAVRIAPYYANVACQALLAGRAIDADKDDLDRVRRWIAWYVAHTRPDGTILDHLGTISHYEPSPKRDSIDTYPPSFLTLIQRFDDATDHKETASLLAPAKFALKAIEKSIDPADGLAWSSVPHKVKYPMDNIEVAAGLDDGARFFERAGANDEAATARRLRDRCGDGIAGFWLADRGYFAWARSTRLHVRFERGYPEGVVNAFAAGRLDPPRPPILWENLKRTFANEPRITPDLWLVAAHRCGRPAEVEQYRRATIAATRAENLTLERAARLCLALLSGREPSPIALVHLPIAK